MPRHFDPLDNKILQMLSANARIPFLKIAEACGVSGAAIHQRVQKLIASGIIKGYETLISPEALGYETCAYVGFLLTDPEKFDDVVAALHKIPEIVELHYTTGQYDLMMKIYARNNQHLLEILHSQIQNLKGGRTETLISFREEFRRQVPTRTNLSEND